MISLIVCSVNPGYFQSLEKNVSETIGVRYELLVWDNRIDNLGLCAVYNKMIARAQFDHICFLHEDLIFETNGWGQKLLEVFQADPAIGAIGVAGNKYKSAAFSGWFTGIKELDCCNIIHRYSYGDERLLMKPNDEKQLEEVVCLDGVFICCKKQLLSKVNFDEKNIPGFHFYDIDFSLRLSTVSKIVVTYDIDILHITVGGDFGDRWVRDAVDYHQRLKKQLPCTKLESYSINTDKVIMNTWLDVLKNYDIRALNKWRWIRIQKLYLYPTLYYSIVKFLVYKPLRLKFLHKKIKSRK